MFIYYSLIANYRSHSLIYFCYYYYRWMIVTVTIIITITTTITIIILMFLSIILTQVDNYSESAVYPVLIHSLKKDKSNNENTKSNSDKHKDKDNITEDGEEVPLLQISLIEETAYSSSTLKYVAVR